MRLPLSPGVYIMKNGKGKIIYIGKAKVLKNRVSQYFGSQNTHSAKVRKMVENVRDFDYILCQSEFEALILECSLIKQNKPKYNILLKDDKGYSYLEVTNEEWPHMEMVRRKQDDGGTYLGPYLSTFVINESLDAARKIFKLPDCSRTFPCTGAQRRPCLNYHMGYCSAPCAGKISKEEYRESIDEAVRFLRGGSKPYLEELEQRMEEYSTNLEFEKAAEIRDRILAIRKLSEKQKVIFTGTETEDVFALARQAETICLNVLRFTSGMLTGSENYVTALAEYLENTRSEMLKRYYTAHDNVPSRIVLDGPCDDQELLEQWLTELAGKKAVIQVPQKGKQFELVNMSKNNAYEKMAQSHRRKKTDSAVIELGELLGLASPPEFIESYDISHTGGADAVGAMVVFRNGIPYRQSYRKFIIKEAQGGDDYGSMREVLTRRFNRYLKESAELQEGEKPKGFARLPDLILMDGGLGQVHIAEEVLKELGLKVPVFGMVKDSRHRTRAIASDGGEITIAQSRKVFALVTGIQDEVHRSAITYHHKRHSAVARHSELTDVPGIGPKKSDILLREFVTIDAIRRADIDTLAKTPGISIKDAASIKKYFHYEN